MSGLTPPSAPVSNRDFAFFYEGLADQRLLVKQCTACGLLRNPPGPMCPRCNALTDVAVALAGTGRVFSFMVHHHPPLPSFPTPHAIALVEMTEGVRILGGLIGIAPDAIEIGQAVRAEFYDNAGVPFFRFRPDEQAQMTDSPL